MRSISLTCLILCCAAGRLATAQSGYPAQSAPSYSNDSGAYAGSTSGGSSYATYPASNYPASNYSGTTYPGSNYPASGSTYPVTSYPTSPYPATSPVSYPTTESYSPAASPSYTPAAPSYGPTSGAEPWVRPAGYDEPSVYRQYLGNELLPPPEPVPLLPDDVAPAPPGSKTASEDSPDSDESKDGAAATDKAGDSEPPAVKSLPLLDPFPSWLQFKDFNASKFWSGTIQLGLNGAEGNANTFNIASGYDVKRETKETILTSDLKYNKATNRKVETQHNAIFNGKAEWLFPTSPWTAFGRTYLEYDEFKAFDLRVVTNAGAGYRLIDRDKTKLTSRFGSGFSHEIGGPDDSYVPEAVMGMDFSHQFTPKQKFNAKGDYFPEWGDFSNYRIVTTADWELLFDQVANLSLKIGITDRYDSTSNGLKPNDFTYSTLILWKL